MKAITVQQAWLPDDIPEPIKWRNWKPSEWFALLGIVLAGLGLVFRKAIPATYHYLKLWAEMPTKMHKIESRQGEIYRMIAASRERMRVMLDLSRDAIFELDDRGNCIFANRVMLNLLGLRFDDLAGTAWLGVAADEEREEVIKLLREHIAAGRGFTTTYHWTTAEGGRIHVRLHARCMRDETTIIGWVIEVTRIGVLVKPPGESLI